MSFDMEPDHDEHALCRREIQDLEAEIKQLQALIRSIRLEFIGCKTPHPAQREWRELWDKMVAAEAVEGE